MRRTARWIRYGCFAAIFYCCISVAVSAQQFVEAGFRSYPLKNAPADQVEQSLRQFLSQNVSSDELIDVVADARGARILVRASPDVLRGVDEFIQAIDRPAAVTKEAFAQAAKVVRPYPMASEDEMQRKLAQLRQHYQGRADVRIAADSRTRQLVVHAPLDVHNEIANAWSQPNAVQPAVRPNALPGNALPENVSPIAPQRVQSARQFSGVKQIQLQHIDWRTLLQGMRGVQGVNPAITSPQEGELQMSLQSSDGSPVDLRIDQQNQVVRISGNQASTDSWTRVVQALDQQPTAAGELQATGRLGDAKAGTITQTIAMLGGAGGATQPLRTIGEDRAAWGGDVVNQMFRPQQQPIQLAQAGDAAAPPMDIETAAVLGGDDAAGSFLGPVRIEFLEGTDIFIVRGQKRDVDRVMKIINNIETLTAETEPSIVIKKLKYINSEALADLISQLNATGGVLAARQGDVSITALAKPNSVLLIGRPAGVSDVIGIIEKLDVPAEASSRFRVIPLTHLPAVDAETTINFLYNQQAQQNTDEGATLNPRVRAIADFRSNSIIVQGSPVDIDEIEELLKQIDQKEGTTANEVRVFTLKNAIAEEVAEVLNETLGTDQSSQAQGGGQAGFGNQQGGGNQTTANTQASSSRRAMSLQMKVMDDKQKQLLDNEMLESGILSNVVVTFNERINSVVVTAPAGSMELIAEIIRQLDERPSQEAEIRVFTIINGDAQTLTEMLDTLFPQEDSADGALVQSAAGTSESTLVPLRFGLDPRTNSIIATGNQADLGVVEAILLKLDANDVRRKTFVYELLNQQATVVADAITQYVLQKRSAITSIAPDTLSANDLIAQEIVVVGEDFSNKVIVSVSDRYYDEVMQLLRDLDKRPDMVMVKCLIAEVDLNSTEEFGVELGIQDSLLFNRSAFVDGIPVPGFNFNNQALGGNVAAPGSARDQVAGQALSSFGLGRSNSELGYGGLVLSASNESVSILLRALQEARRLDVLSRPQVMMLNNQEGEIQVGASVPFIGDTINTGLTTTNTVEFIEVGLILSVIPRISPDGLVVMDVLADKSELGSIEDGIPISISASGEILRQPQINRTRAETIVSARDGQTVILGGLITKDRSAFERKVPYLADIPILGKLFRTEGVAESRTELLVILTPHIVRDETDINQINSEEYARMSWCLGNVIETHGDIGPTNGFEHMIDGEVIYSELAPTGQSPATNGNVPQGSGHASPMYHSMPAESMPIQNAPVPIPTESMRPAPAMISPPLPSVLPEGIPQAQQSMKLNAPLTQRPTSSSASMVRPASVSMQDEQKQLRTLGEVESHDVDKPRRALFRFEEIPTFGTQP